jgi:AraC-like DNA-binding protein
MNFIFEERLSDSTFVEKIWRTHSAQEGSFISSAVCNWEIVVLKYHGGTILTVRGPETKATLAYCPPNAEFFGIQFKLGAYMPHLPASSLLDRAVNLPEATSRSFWLNGSAWQFPDYQNADVFVDRLARDGLLTYEPAVEVALQGRLKDLSLRSAQRCFLRATGLTRNYIRQIERARQAAALLEHGTSILDTVFEAGYADQPHLTRSLKHFIGQTPAQIARQNGSG